MFFKPISDGLIAHEEDKSSDLNNQPLRRKWQPLTADLLASDGQVHSGYECWVVSGQSMSSGRWHRGRSAVKSYESAPLPWLPALAVSCRITVNAKRGELGPWHSLPVVSPSAKGPWEAVFTWAGCASDDLRVSLIKQGEFKEVRLYNTVLIASKFC